MSGTDMTVVKEWFTAIYKRPENVALHAHHILTDGGEDTAVLLFLLDTPAEWVMTSIKPRQFWGDYVLTVGQRVTFWGESGSYTVEEAPNLEGYFRASDGHGGTTCHHVSSVAA